MNREAYYRNRKIFVLGGALSGQFVEYNGEVIKYVHENNNKNRVDITGDVCIVSNHGNEAYFFAEFATSPTDYHGVYVHENVKVSRRDDDATELDQLRTEVKTLQRKLTRATSSRFG